MEVSLKKEFKGKFKERASDHPAHLKAYSRDTWPFLMIRFQGGEKPITLPDLVVWPESVDEASWVLQKAGSAGVSVIPYGGGSGVCGGAVPENGGIVVDLKRMKGVRRLDFESMLVEVEAGANGERFERYLERHNLTLGHFPSSIYCSTVGGWVATRSAGQLSTLYGKIEDMVEAMEVVLPDGSVLATKDKPRSASGPDFNQIFTGSEGTLGIITSVTLRVKANPEVRSFRGVKFKNVYSGIDAIREMMQSGIIPSAVRLYDELDTMLTLSDLSEKKGEKKEGFFKQVMMRAQRFALSHPSITRGLLNTLPGECLLILAFDGLREEVEFMVKRALEICEKYDGSDQGERPGILWWNDRYKVSYNMSPVFYGGSFVDTIEVAGPWSKLRKLYDEMRKAISEEAVVMAHFSHAYKDGCSIYFTFAATASNPEEKEKKYRAIWESAMNACLEVGGSITHHHGVGRLKAPYVQRELGGLYELLAKFKRLLDPRGIMNPGVMGLG